MNRKLLLQITAPAVLIGLLLFITCLAGVWYINWQQRNLVKIFTRNVASLQAAQELEIRVRQLRFHWFLFLIEPKPERRQRIESDHQNFEEALERAKQSVHTPEERACVQDIEAGYHQYRDEMARLESQPPQDAQQANLASIADAHPVHLVVDPCQELLRVNKDMMDQTARASDRVGWQASVAMILLGLMGPVSGIIIGYGIARGLSRSIYQLSVRVQDMAQRLDQDVASVSIAADGDLQGLDKQLQHVVGKVEEVAERLQQHQREMLRAEQLSAVGQLAASVAHEVRNPLTSIKMLVEAALRQHNRKPLSPDDLQVIHGEIARLEQTVQSFLDFARLPAPRRASCDLREVTAQAIELIRARAHQQGVEIIIHKPEETVPGSIDRAQVCTVLVNLCLNALDVMPRGGQLVVSLEFVPGIGAQISVADTGSGIPAEMVNHLFTPFSSTKPTGTGLGLSISRRIIEEHGGRISGSNRPPGGACFTFSLPADQNLLGCPATIDQIQPPDRNLLALSAERGE